jgi:hypothetical protein
MTMLENASECEVCVGVIRVLDTIPSLFGLYTG